MAAGPGAHASFLQSMRDQWSQSLLGRFDMKSLQSVPPEALMAAQRDPSFYQAIKELSDDPSSATMARWIDHPAIGPIVAALWRGMQR